MSRDRTLLLAEESAAYDRLERCAAAEAVAFAQKIAAVWDAERVGRELRAADLVVCEVALSLCISEAAASILLVQAAGCRRHPDSYRLLAHGRLGVPHLTAFLDALGELDPEVAVEIEQVVLPEIADRTPSEIRMLVRKAVLTHDPEAAARRREARQAERHVSLHPQSDGMAGLWALTGAVEAQRVDRRLSALAREHQRRHPDDPRTIKQLRVDLLVAAVTGELDPGVGRNAAGVQISLQVPVSVALGLADAPGELTGYGPVDPEYVRTLLPDAELRRVCVDLLTGATVASSDETLRPETVELLRAEMARMATEPVVDLDLPEPRYRPSARLADRVRRRDATCEFGRCRVVADRCDLDHRDPWPAGVTNAANLGAKSRRHHRAKQAGWTVTHQPDGSIITTSPSGRRYRRPPRSDPPPPISRAPSPAPEPARRFDPALGAIPELPWQSVLEQAWLDRPPDPPPKVDDPHPDEPPF